MELDKLATSLAKFQAECPIITPDRSVEVTMKSGGKYKFRYATLGNIINTTRPLLAKNGLSVIQLVGGKTLTTMLLHESGQYIETVSDVDTSGGNMQELGSRITYLRRYAHTAILGVVGDDDDDGNTAMGNHIQDAPKAKPKADPPAPQAKPKADPPAPAEPITEAPAGDYEGRWGEYPLPAKISKPTKGQLQMLTIDEWNKLEAWSKNHPEYAQLAIAVSNYTLPF